MSLPSSISINESTPVFVVFANDDLIGYCEREQEVISLMNELVSTHIKQISDDATKKVFRRDIPNGIEVCYQTLGYIYNSSVYVHATISYRTLPKILFTSK